MSRCAPLTVNFPNLETMLKAVHYLNARYILPVADASTPGSCLAICHLAPREQTALARFHSSTCQINRKGFLSFLAAALTKQKSCSIQSQCCQTQAALMAGKLPRLALISSGITAQRTWSRDCLVASPMIACPCKGRAQHLHARVGLQEGGCPQRRWPFLSVLVCGR